MNQNRDNHEWVDEFIDLADETAISSYKLLGAIVGFAIAIYIMC